MLINIQRDDLLKLFDLDIEFTEEYRRGVNETWGGRAIACYELLYKLLHDVSIGNTYSIEDAKALLELVPMVGSSTIYITS